MALAQNKKSKPKPVSQFKLATEVTKHIQRNVVAFLLPSFFGMFNLSDEKLRKHAYWPIICIEAGSMITTRHVFWWFLQTITELLKLRYFYMLPLRNLWFNTTGNNNSILLAKYYWNKILLNCENKKLYIKLFYLVIKFLEFNGLMNNAFLSLGNKTILPKLY